MARDTHATNPAQAFYDEFLTERMVSYRVSPNQRIVRAIEFALPNITSTSRILDIGCGIGIVTEAMARKARQGEVWACDLSPRNIWYAEKTVREPNVRFHVADVISESSPVQAALGRFDVITMVDVLEHIPRAKQEHVFRRLGELANENARLLLTMPSVEYQRLLREHRPSELQPVDEEIELADLAVIAARTGWRVVSFRYVDMPLLSNQYVHCALARRVACEEKQTPRALHRRVASVVLEVARRIARRRRRKKYIDDVFGAKNSLRRGAAGF